MQLELSDPGDRLIGSVLIDMLDEAGYVRGDLEDVAEQAGCALDRVERVLAILQSFEPAGLFARDLRECLMLQLKDLNRYDPAMAALLDNLDLLAKREFAQLERLCGVDREDLTDMMAEIRELDPKPGAAHEGVLPAPVIPDVLMRANPQGGWILELNADTLPRVLVNESYLASVGGAGGEAKAYLTEQLASANWLVKALHQRATTILKVATELVRQQDGFFTHGVSHLRPLVLRDIATVIDMHESTVSRVTSNKYMSTPRGVLELKYFFTTAIASAEGGEAHSSEAVRHRIRALVDGESPKKILSDDKIVELLKQEGIDIARRTVAKYREAMRIPSSVQRRREKKALLG
jgi:RNA polymerase sigma-54 factor